MFKTGILILISIFLYNIINNFSYLCDGIRFICYKHYQKESNNFIKNDISSSLWCSSEDKDHKTCEFHDICYFPKSENQFLFLYTNKSVILGLNSREELKTISLSSVSNHNGVLLKLTLINSHDYLLKNVLNLNENVLIIWRFKSDNIMHVIHDDLIPIFMTYREICKRNIDKCVSKYRLGFVDGGEPGPYYEWYKIFSNSEPLLLSKEDHHILCFRNGRIGLSTESVWYQYGFQQVHGPMKTRMDGNLLKEFTDYVLRQFKINTDTNYLDKPIAILFNRKINRKIINENFVTNEMAHSFKKIFPNQTLEIHNLDLSQNSTISILSLLVKADIVVGMHGSVMILAMFLPPLASIVELFPFGIQPEFVSPLRAMCALPAVSQRYISWTNPKETNSVMHPNNPPLLGGIAHLSEEMQRDLIKVKEVPPVECCHNPLYLFRMYQDTVVDETFTKVFQDAILARKKSPSHAYGQYVLEQINFRHWYFPSVVTNITCTNTKTDFTLSWNKPYNVDFENVEYQLAIKLGERDISLTTSATVINIKTTIDKSTTVHIWIKSKVEHNESIDIYSKCEIVK